ncbi:Phosphoglycolate phosphatase [Zhongshania aliphaticivorans]|uniref:Phosphoglycolate phosphatase n=1 Tax=Zhongshania aliphaticivorans TaxID=1470434 RepID=A0A5S9NHI2_9GAMM|nr:HAD-IA family hydrolase [Zhongshania aliphaticivorans]CAA0089404.1 Phosphoglycolate phosphatase [Zhongshania aliphaticivorans]CAA0096172.1 Phosphoglycolate phosphatase [Zhongshania aliphaticivorans]
MLIIFDWDGTIIDSSDKIVFCMQQAASQCGFPVCSADSIRNIIGLELSVAIAMLYPELDSAAVQEIRAWYVRCFIEADKEPCQLFPGVESTLHALKHQGHDLCVATGKSRRGLDRVFTGLDISALFSASRCADETASKPDPLMLHQLCVEMSVNPCDAVMVGDTEYDLEMANKIAMPSVGVSYGAHSSERLVRWSPLVIIDEFASLVTVLGSHHSM